MSCKLARTCAAVVVLVIVSGVPVLIPLNENVTAPVGCVLTPPAPPMTCTALPLAVAIVEKLEGGVPVFVVWPVGAARRHGS